MPCKNLLIYKWMLPCLQTNNKLFLKVITNKLIWSTFYVILSSAYSSESLMICFAELNTSVINCFLGGIKIKWWALWEYRVAKYCFTPKNSCESNLSSKSGGGGQTYNKTMWLGAGAFIRIYWGGVKFNFFSTPPQNIYTSSWCISNYWF